MYTVFISIVLLSVTSLYQNATINKNKPFSFKANNIINSREKCILRTLNLPCNLKADLPKMMYKNK